MGGHAEEAVLELLEDIELDILLLQVPRQEGKLGVEGHEVLAKSRGFGWVRLADRQAPALAWEDVEVIGVGFLLAGHQVDPVGAADLR